jgi:hypothetical protein
MTTVALPSTRAYGIGIECPVKFAFEHDDIINHLNSDAPAHGCTDIVCEVSLIDERQCKRYRVFYNADSEERAQALHNSLTHFMEKVWLPKVAPSDPAV